VNRTLKNGSRATVNYMAVGIIPANTMSSKPSDYSDFGESLANIQEIFRMR